MGKKKIGIVIIIVVIAILACLMLSHTLTPQEKPDTVIKIDKIKFNMTNESNITNFTLKNKNSDEGYNYSYYTDNNNTGYNVWIFDLSKSEGYLWNVVLNSIKNDKYNNIPSQTVNGVVVYTTSAEHGNHFGEPRYDAYVANSDLKTIVLFSTPNPNETANMTLSLKFDDK